mgnify:CR=1 FL=1
MRPVGDRILDDAGDAGGARAILDVALVGVVEDGAVRIGQAARQEQERIGQTRFGFALEGFDQVLWTDAKEHKYIDEAGVMNVMFVVNGKLITPKLTSALLEGVTRDSILTLAPGLGMTVEQRKVSVAEIEEAFKNGTITEAFGTGTAAVVSPIATINIHGVDYNLPAAGKDSFQQRVKEKLNNIRLGFEPDVYGWNYIIPS